MSACIAVANLIVIFLIAYWEWRKTPLLKRIFWPAFLIKLLSGVLLGLLYIFYYPSADTFTYYEDGVTLAEYGHNNFFNYLKFLWSDNESFSIWNKLSNVKPRGLFMVKVVSIFCWFTAGNYWIISCYFSFITFICSWKLVGTLIHYFPQYKLAAVVAFLFFPSALFWSSGLIKESLAMATMFIISITFLKIWKKDRVSLGYILAACISVVFLWKLKYYYAALFIPVLCTSLFVKFILLRFINQKPPWVEILVWATTLLLPLFIVSLLKPNFYPQNFLQVVVDSYSAFHALSKPGGAIQFYNLQPNFTSILRNFPMAFFSGLLRPFLWEASTILQFAMSVENLVLFFLIVTALKNIPVILPSPDRLLIISILVYAFFLCVFLSLSTPNFGTLSRYRIGFIPFLVFVLMCNNSVVNRLARLIQRSFLHLVR